LIQINENYGIVLIMGILTELLNKVPQLVKDKYKINTIKNHDDVVVL
tara:strand:+ start:219 stop:359 length:141 start_codon:yes stop_codon:yes gene_type:complete